MLKLILTVVFFFVGSAFGYFTLPGKCPENVQLQTEFRLADFFNKWHQVYHYSSDGQQLNNCSVLELKTTPLGIFLNQSRVDRRLFHRYSIGRLEIPTSIENGAHLDVTFNFEDQPRRHDQWNYEIMNISGCEMSTVYDTLYFASITSSNGADSQVSVANRRYPFRVLRTDYNNYASVYTCEYSQLIDKHYIYVWILSRKPVFNVVSMELATRPLSQIGVNPEKLVKDDLSKCSPKYFDDIKAEPTTFRYPVVVRV